MKSTQIPKEIFERTKISGKLDIDLHQIRTRQIFRVIKPLGKKFKSRESAKDIELEPNKRKSELIDDNDDIIGRYPTKHILSSQKIKTKTEY